MRALKSSLFSWAVLRQSRSSSSNSLSSSQLPCFGLQLLSPVESPPQLLLLLLLLLVVVTLLQFPAVPLASADEPLTPTDNLKSLVLLLIVEQPLTVVLVVTTDVVVGIISTVVVCFFTVVVGNETLSTGGSDTQAFSGARSGESNSSGASSRVDAGLNL